MPRRIKVGDRVRTTVPSPIGLPVGSRGTVREIKGADFLFEVEFDDHDKIPTRMVDDPTWPMYRQEIEVDE
jgi:hypothetical protein